MAKVHDDTVPARRTFPTIGGRACGDEIGFIDRAAREVGEKRGIFLVVAAVERAEAVLGETCPVRSRPERRSAA